MPRFLFLQGAASPFFSRLADRLGAEGLATYRFNFCAGDALYWRGKAAWNFRGTTADLPARFEENANATGITDVVLFGDQRPVHRAVIPGALRAGMRVHVFEEGYVRPRWITLERHGLAAASRLPRAPEWYLRAAANLPVPDETRCAPSTLGPRALHDVAYHAANVLNPLLYPRYRTHRPYPAPAEWAGWAWRFARFPVWIRRDARRLREWISAGAPFFVFPLQLNGDAQLVYRSPFGSMREALRHVLTSFAAYAPRDTRLVVKNHPLDTGLAGHAVGIGRLARELGLEGRVLYVETGDLGALLRHAAGVVTVNSTSGMAALAQGCPTKALGTAIYDVPRLTDQRTLDAFWTAPAPPDAEVFRAFRKVIIHATQIRGDFYDRRGMDVALESASRLLEPRSRIDLLLECFPAVAA